MEKDEQQPIQELKSLLVENNREFPAKIRPAKNGRHQDLSDQNFHYCYHGSSYPAISGQIYRDVDEVIYTWG